jgi:hypothetical protein
MYTDQHQALRLGLFILHIYFHNVVTILHTSSHAQGSLFIFSILVYIATVSICTTGCRWYENEIWVTVTARGNRSSPWKTRLCHFVHHKCRQSGTRLGFSPNISVYHARCIPNTEFLSTTKVNTCVSIAITHFMAKFNLAVDIHIRHKVNPINNTRSTNFLGLTLDSTLSWKTHIDQLSSKLNSAFYVIRSLKSVISTKNLRTIYFSYVHSIIAYGIIFWGNSPYSYNIFKLQKRAIRIIMNAGNRVACRELFKKLNILPLYSQYILSLLLFVVMNIDEFTSNFDVHTINTRHRSDLHPPSIKLTKYQKGAYYSGIKIFNYLSQNIKNLYWNVKKN